MSTADPQTNEARRSPRAATQCKASARVAVAVEIIDASPLGVRTRMSLPVPVGTLFKITLPGGNERHARVAWVDAQEIGCEFLSPLSPAEFKRLTDAGAAAAPMAA